MNDDLKSLGCEYAEMWRRVPESHTMVLKFTRHNVFMTGYNLNDARISASVSSSLQAFQNKHGEMRSKSKFFWMTNDQITDWVALNEDLLHPLGPWPDDLRSAFSSHTCSSEQHHVIVLMVKSGNPDATTISFARKNVMPSVGERTVQMYRALIDKVHGTCAICKANTVLTCSSCLVVSYCCVHCQRQHFKTHKKQCELLRDRRNVIRLADYLEI